MLGAASRLIHPRRSSLTFDDLGASSLSSPITARSPPPRRADLQRPRLAAPRRARGRGRRPARHPLPRRRRADRAGRLLVEHARAALDRLALAEVQVSDLVAHEQRRVRLAGHSSSLTRLIPLAVADLRRRLPDAEVTIREAGPPGALDALRSGDVDLAVMFRREGTEAPPDVEEHLLLEESMYAVVPRAHPLAGARRSTSPACATTPGSRARPRPRPG